MKYLYAIEQRMKQINELQRKTEQGYRRHRERRLRGRERNSKGKN